MPHPARSLARFVRRGARAWAENLHTRRDQALLRELETNPEIGRQEVAEIARRWRSGSSPFAETALPRLLDDLRQEQETAAESLLGDRLETFGWINEIGTGATWRDDPLRAAPWPLVPHAKLRLVDPDAGGDVRMAWEPARFHQAIPLARAWRATGEERFGAALLRQIASFRDANPPYLGIHWSVGMEVAIRGTAWALALEVCAGSIDPLAAQEIVGALVAHARFLETHVERHPAGWTTNHTLADHAGLAVLGRLFQGSEAGRRWLRIAAEGLAECLDEQVIAGGAHAEGSLLYERFALETALVGAMALDAADAAPLRGPLLLLARHLSAARIGALLPAVGDGDESIFPPFALHPFARREPRDPSAALCAAEAWLGPLGPPSPDPGPEPLGGLIRFRAGSFDGALVHRRAGQGWMSTHGHNDQLSLLLDVAGVPVLIDPGTGGYTRDPVLRHTLRRTSAHSTLEIAGAEQSPLRREALFEGPREIPGGITRTGPGPARIAAWIEAPAGVRHRREIGARRGLLWVRDEIEPLDGQCAVSTLRFRLAPGLPVRCDGRSAEIRLPHGVVRLLLLRPRGIAWQIRRAEISPRYGVTVEAPVLEAEGAGQTSWRTAILYEPDADPS